MLNFLQNVVLITGHYGSGKTNLAVNLAVDLNRQGHQVVLIDLDIVNPYFRTADFGPLAAREGITLYTPPFANSNLDIPVLAAGLEGYLGSDKTVIVDVGGDDGGAVALGGFAARIARQPYTMLYVINRYRYLTRQPQEAAALLEDIEAASRLKATHLVNNSHLCHLTTAKDVEQSMEFAAGVGQLSQRPLAFTACERSIAREFNDKSCIYPIDVFVKTPWQTHQRETTTL